MDELRLLAARIEKIAHRLVNEPRDRAATEAAQDLVDNARVFERQFIDVLVHESRPTSSR